MGNCCTGNSLNKIGGIDSNDHDIDLIPKEVVNLKTTTNNDECSIIQNSISNELNYNVKYKPSTTKYNDQKRNQDTNH